MSNLHQLVRDSVKSCIRLSSLLRQASVEHAYSRCSVRSAELCLVIWALEQELAAARAVSKGQFALAYPSR